MTRIVIRLDVYGVQFALHPPPPQFFGSRKTLGSRELLKEAAKKFLRYWSDHQGVACMLPLE